MRFDADVMFVAGLCGLGFLLASLLWQLLVRPSAVWGLFERRSLADLELGVEEESELPLRVARWSLGALVFLTGLLAGAATAFLAATAR
ncbi:MAG: hypothetical protein H6732_04645 [Alphaproteobacteria bacterium]|nr:hypothetical protein [Alphaproteobacteria bacterium]